MQFFLNGPFQENLAELIRKIGYHYIGGNEEKSEYNFIRTLGGGGGYPRFHIYMVIDEKNSRYAFNLHLDQKKPVYRGATAHSGEYDGHLVESEKERVVKILSAQND